MATVEGLTSEIARWVSDSRNKDMMYTAANEKIDQCLGESNIRSSAVIAGRLEMLSIWYGAAGCDLLLRKVGGGDWESLARSVRYRVLADEILIRLTEMDQRRTRQPRVEWRTVILTIAKCITLGMAKHAQSLQSKCLGAVNSGVLGNLDDCDLAKFLLPIYTGKIGETSGRSGSELNAVYATIIDTWETPEKLGDSIEKLCDFHLERIDDPDDDLILEYDQYPETIWPVEVLSILRVREQMRLQNPKIRHPLLETRLCNVPPDLAHEPDEIENKVRSKYSDFLA